MDQQMIELPTAVMHHRGVQTLTLFVPGKAQTAGSKTIVPTGAGPRVVDGGTKASRAAKRTWRGDLRDAAYAAIERGDWPDVPVADEPLELVFIELRRRPSTHLTTGKAAGLVKDWARDLRPVARPDVLKLARAAEDALTGIVYADDSQIVEERLHKVFGDQGGGLPTSEGAIVVVRRAGATYLGPRLDTVV